jgi:CBS domain containing-hemolysin-like protein
MAEAEVSRMPVVDRGDESRVIGIVSLSQLLAGRQRDQIEARERERTLRIRLAVPTLPGRSASTR